MHIRRPINPSNNAFSLNNMPDIKGRAKHDGFVSQGPQEIRAAFDGMNVLRKNTKKLDSTAMGMENAIGLAPSICCWATRRCPQIFAWFEETFPDDTGHPMQFLCWTLALYRSGQLEAAKQKLRQTMLSNLYFIPRLLGIEHQDLDVSDGTNVNGYLN
jgi:hypothetical protein